jgi:hypothetical protein
LGNVNSKLIEVFGHPFLRIGIRQISNFYCIITGQRIVNNKLGDHGIRLDFPGGQRCQKYHGIDQIEYNHGYLTDEDISSYTLIIEQAVILFMALVAQG